MRDPKRIDRIVDKLRKLWHTRPDMRLGQLVMNVTRDETGSVSKDRAFNIEDDAIELEIERTLRNWSPANPSQ